MYVDLVFSSISSTDTNLVFGSNTFVPKNNTATISGEISSIYIIGNAKYLSLTQRPIVGKSNTTNKAMVLQVGSCENKHQDASKLQYQNNTNYQKTYYLNASIKHKLPDTLKPYTLIQKTTSQNATYTAIYVASIYQDGIYIRLTNDTLWTRGLSRRKGDISYHQDCNRIKRQKTSNWQNAYKKIISYYNKYQLASDFLVALKSLYQDAQTPPPGADIIHHPTPINIPCYYKDGNLIFVASSNNSTTLIFECDTKEIVTTFIPIRRVYYIMNNARLYRASDGLIIPTINFALSIDISSWAWGFNATLPYSAEPLVITPTGPVSIVADVNGTLFKLLVEDISREKTFGITNINISGRGHTSVLSEPYAPILSFNQSTNMTAQQLCNEILKYNGVSIGWTIDWELVDWNIPANVFTHQGVWIDALAKVVNAAGGYILPDKYDNILYIKPKYPLPPWQWSTITPDISLPIDAVQRESTKWVEKPNYNRVYVSGENVGIIGCVTRTGTAGDEIAPMVVDPLITEEPAARQKGTEILSDTGKQLEISLRLPLLSGIIEPGKIISYNNMIGIVRSTSIDVSYPDIWQSIGVEIHE